MERPMIDILIIDDSSTSRMYYRELLEEDGFRVEEAINGLEGLEKVMSQNFGLILVDLNMPKMDGYTFLDQLRRDPELRAVAAIMISTEGRDSDRTKAYAAGANAYIVKPADPVELAAHARLMTGQAPVRSASA
jgi:two-component system chemotaxis response regulator CheY